MKMQAFFNSLEQQISWNTMISHLQEEGLRKWKKQDCPQLNEHQAATRLEWALQHRHWTTEDWGKVLWSDECSVEQSSGVRQEWVYQPLAEKWKPLGIQTKNKTQVSIMVSIY